MSSTSNATPDLPPKAVYSTVIPGRTRENDHKALIKVRAMAVQKNKAAARKKARAKEAREKKAQEKTTSGMDTEGPKEAATAVPRIVPKADIPEYHDDFSSAYTPVVLELNNIFEEGTFKLPEKFNPNAVKEPWSCIGYPFDETLVLPDIEEERTQIDYSRVDVKELIQDMMEVLQVGSKPLGEIKDVDSASIETTIKDDLTIETIRLHGRKVVKVKVANADATKGDYSRVLNGKNLEKAVDKGFGKRPPIRVVNFIGAQVLLCTGGEVSDFGPCKDLIPALEVE